MGIVHRGLSVETTSTQSRPHPPLTDGDKEEVDEPGEGVLVHWVDVGQVSDGEEENRAMGRHWSVASSRLFQLLLCLFSNL